MSDDVEQTPEERIRHRAYELWEQAGRPHGRTEEFWSQAKVEFEAEIVEETNKIIDQARSKE